MSNPIFSPPDLPLDSFDGPIIKVYPPHAQPGESIVFELAAPSGDRQHYSNEIPMTEIYY